jgi:N6-L-threonylcarbamoyladenine synthase
MNILAIETSCDETAAAIVHEGRWVRANIVASQIALHEKYGGIVPELASRQHVTAIVPVLEAAFDVAGVTREDIDAIAVTEGPGLAGSLLVGVNMAKTLAFAWKKPLVPVNHLEGHVYANWLIDDVPGEDHANTEPVPPQFPAVCLIVSGGHTDLLLIHKHGVYEILGRTLDDAAGEAFDKGARVLGLGYPGGPAIQRAAEGHRPLEPLPRAWLGDTYDFSFSGLKTALLRVCDQYRVPQPPKGRGKPRAVVQQPFPEHEPPAYKPNMPVGELAAAYQDAIVDVLVEKTIRAAQQEHARSVMLSGGVAANALLRGRMESRLRALNLPLHVPAIQFCTDNAAMIAAAGYQVIRRGALAGWELDVRAQLPWSALPGVRVTERPRAAR